MIEEKECGKCGEIKPLSEFPTDKTKKSGLHAHCKVCRKAFRAELRAKTKTGEHVPAKGTKKIKVRPRRDLAPEQMKKVTLVTMSVGADRIGDIEADANRYAIRTLIEQHVQEYERYCFEYQMANGHVPFVRKEDLEDELAM